MSNPKSHADLLFEQYLRSQGLNSFEYEKEWEGITKHPDYSVFEDKRTFIFEVKSMDPKPPLVGFGFNDPYKSIRREIEGARTQFRPFKGMFPCSLVLWSPDDPYQLLDPIKIGGAMYGDVGLRVYFNSDTGQTVEKESETVFHKRGKMIRPGQMEAQNTTFSALISLSAYPVGQLWNRFRNHFDESELKRMNLFETNDTNEVVPGVTVWENGFAKLPFPRDMFCGAFDHRFIVENGRFNPSFIGKAWKAVQTIDQT